MGTAANARVEPLEHTPEDQLAWSDVHFRLGRMGQFLWGRSLVQDGRDGELIYEYEKSKASYIAKSGIDHYLTARWSALMALLLP